MNQGVKMNNEEIKRLQEENPHALILSSEQIKENRPEGAVRYNIVGRSLHYYSETGKLLATLRKEDIKPLH